MYLVTGCDGYFGSTLIFELERLQIRTIGLSRNTAVFAEYKFNYVSFHDYTFLDKLIDDDFSTVVHCAGLSSTRLLDFESYYLANVQLTERVARFAKNNKIPHFFYLSTVKVYGANYYNAFNVNSISIESLYAQSKLEAEKALKKYEDSLFVHILRLPNIVFSPRIELKSYSLLSLDLCFQIVNNGNIRLNSDSNSIVTILPGLIVLNYLIDKPDINNNRQGYEVVDFGDSIAISLGSVKRLVERIFNKRIDFYFGLNAKKYSIEQFQFNETLNNKVLTEFREDKVLAIISSEILKTLIFFKSKL